MSFSSRFGFGRSRKVEELERRIAHLQAALNRRSEGTGARFRREVTIAILMLALGFAFGLNREPIQQAVNGLAQTLGLARGSGDAAYAAYQEGHYGTALRLARPLAAEGDARAQSVLGLLYYGGEVVPQDKAEAVRWFRRAAEQGDAQAQHNLGLAYAKGEAGEPDNVSAHMWFNLAAAHFPLSDAINRSASRKDRDLVAEKMTPEQIAEAQKLAREWKPRSN
jgi:TPR repeat protein